MRKAWVLSLAILSLVPFRPVPLRAEPGPLLEVNTAPLPPLSPFDDEIPGLLDGDASSCGNIEGLSDAQAYLQSLLEANEALESSGSTAERAAERANVLGWGRLLAARWGCPLDASRVNVTDEHDVHSYLWQVQGCFEQRQVACSRQLLSPARR